ncbi:MAG: amidase family protein, partial [Alphaproteobacteria bacterium]
FRGAYALAALAAEAAPVWTRCDAMVVPTAPRHWTVAELRAEPVARNSALGTWTNFVNLMDLAALAVPTGFHPNGLPVGVTLIGPAGSDLALADLGGRLHAAGAPTLGATGERRPDAALRPAASPSDAIEVAVFGAHLSGEPRNHALAAMGAGLGERVMTAPCYRLVLLEGALPRPGLVRVDAGAAIEGEIWRVPPAALGQLLAEVKPPLALGTVTLADGRQVRGFVCAAGGEAGAPDITRFGGWRAWRRSTEKETA